MKIAIWGVGVSGLGAIKYLSHEKNHQVYVINQGSVDSWYEASGVSEFVAKDRCYNQADCAHLAEELDKIILSPGIDPRIKDLGPYTQVPKISDVEYVFPMIKRPIVAVTGTNGKTTTVTMIQECLESVGKKVFLSGNIGVSPFEAIAHLEDYDYFIFELSSFQLELIDLFRPDIGIILNISPGHMERYDDFSHYVKAKLNITANQQEEDLLLLDPDLMDVETKAEKMSLDFLSGYDFSGSKLLGQHTKKSFFIVEKILERFDISDNRVVMQNFIDQFSGVKYRLQYIGTQKGVDFYNDAKSTNTAATIAALNSFGSKNIGLILGGKLRDQSQDFKPGLKAAPGNISLFLYGQAREFLREQLDDTYKVAVQESLEDVVNDIVLSEFDIILYSPGFPSFDQYKNYIKRGEHFNQIVEKLF